MKHLIGKKVQVVDKSHPHYKEIAKAVSVDNLAVLNREALKLENAEGSFYVYRENQIKVF